MIVLDASAAVGILLNHDAVSLKSRLRTDPNLNAPHLIDAEVAHAVRRLHLSGDVDDDRGRELLSDLRVFPMIRHPHHPFLGRAWELRLEISAYDALYVALAEALDAQLLTRDRRLASAAERYVTVEVV